MAHVVVVLHHVIICIMNAISGRKARMDLADMYGMMQRMQMQRLKDVVFCMYDVPSLRSAIHPLFPHKHQPDTNPLLTSNTITCSCLFSIRSSLLPTPQPRLPQSTNTPQQ